VVSKCEARMKRKTPLIQGFSNKLLFVVGKSLRYDLQKIYLPYTTIM
jgi:hypothetical protein